MQDQDNTSQALNVMHTKVIIITNQGVNTELQVKFLKQ